jgi:hypothetical protein
MTASRYSSEATQRALDTGDLFTLKKAELGHGNWLPYLRDELKFAESTARLWMDLAANRQRVVDILAVDPSIPLRALQAMLREKNAEAQQLLLPGEPGEEDKPTILGELKPDTKVGQIRTRLIEFIESPKATEVEFQAALSLWEKLGEKLQERGLLTDDLRPAQQLAA